MPEKIIVTGGSGGVGAYVVRELLAHGYEVLNLDRAAPADPQGDFLPIDLTDYDAVADAFRGYDAVVHYASDPEPDFDFSTGARRFHNNMLCNYNVFNAACRFEMKKVVWASSETVLGFPFEKVQPKSLPVDESHELMPQNSYAMAKVCTEQLAETMNTLYGVPFVGLRLTNVLYIQTDHPANFEAIPSYWENPCSRSFNLWGYIDARDAAGASRLALESDILNSENFIISAPDTIMRQPNRELVDACFPDVPIDPGLGEHESMLRSKKAEQRLGWRARYSWRRVIGDPVSPGKKHAEDSK